MFGWDIHKWEGPVDYWLVTSGNASTPGINGGLMLQNGPFNGTINTIEVEDIDAANARVMSHGGQMIFDKDIVPGVGYQAYFQDNSGIIVSLHQADSQAGM